MAECKTTVKDHYTLQLSDLLKLRAQSKNYSDWVFQLEFSNWGVPNKFAIISWATLMELWKFKPPEYAGLTAADYFQIGKSFQIKYGDIVKKWGSSAQAPGMVPAFRITFNSPDEAEAGPAGRACFALVSWVVYLSLSDSYEKASNVPG